MIGRIFHVEFEYAETEGATKDTKNTTMVIGTFWPPTAHVRSVLNAVFAANAIVVKAQRKSKKYLQIAVFWGLRKTMVEVTIASIDETWSKSKRKVGNVNFLVQMQVKH